MGAISIRADKKNNKILAELAKRLGGNVLDMDDKQFEDFALGTLMDAKKTGEKVSWGFCYAKIKMAKFAGGKLV